MWAFVHITKTGGTGIEEFVRLHPECRIVGGGHKHTESTYEQRRVPRIFTVVRDPVDRFHSAFNYWKTGALTGTYKRSAFQKSEHQRVYPTLGSFIDALVKRSLLAESVLKHAMGFTWHDHFDQQVKWLNGVHRSTWLLCYDHQNLIRNTNAFLNATQNNCSLPNRLVNPSVSYNRENLTNRQLAWIEANYANDFALWARCKGRSFVKL